MISCAFHISTEKNISLTPPSKYTPDLTPNKQNDIRLNRINIEENPAESEEK